MKRTLWTMVAMALMLILLCGCTDGLTGLRINEITKVEVINLLSDARVEIDQDNEKFETIITLLDECQKSFTHAGDCQPEDGHQYQLIIYIGESVTLNLVVNTDGSFCIGRSRYVLTDSNTETDVGLYLSMLRRATTLDMPYLVETPEELSEPVVLVEDMGWNFICQQIVLDGARYTVLAREDCNGQYQVVWEIREPYGDRVVSSVEYVEKSLIASDDKMLYFSVHNADSGLNKLLGFSTRDNAIVLSMVDPCSNLLIIENSKDSYSGWLVCGNAILSIDLTSGKMIEGKARTISDLGGLPEIEGALFRDPQHITAIRYVELAAGSEAGTIAIQIWQHENDGAPEMIQEYIYDLANLELVG